jgi:4,5-DOPA dioxygenase extradiol
LPRTRNAVHSVMAALPTLFISHGAPDLLLHPEEPAHRFLADLGGTLPRPQAIVVLSAHWQEEVPTVEIGTTPQTIHDFGGFSEALHAMRYIAPGSPVLAQRILGLLTSWSPVGQERGLDHGAWAPLTLMYPDASFPVVQVSLLLSDDPAEHLRLGEALAPLRHEGVLVIGSGSATHNLRRIGSGAAPTWVTGFDDWLVERAQKGDAMALQNYRTEAPFARENHPTAEHFLPLLCALGAAGPDAHGQVLHRSHTYGVLSMSALAFA